MKKVLLILFSIVCFWNNSICSDHLDKKNDMDSLKVLVRKNYVYMQWGGNTPSFSLNYERILLRKQEKSFNIRIGVYYQYIGGSIIQNGQTVYDPKKSNLVFPLEFIYAFENRQYLVEFGTGLTPSILTGDIVTKDYQVHFIKNTLYYFHFGISHVFPKHRILLRFTYNPYFFRYNEYDYSLLENRYNNPSIAMDNSYGVIQNDVAIGGYKQLRFGFLNFGLSIGKNF